MPKPRDEIDRLADFLLANFKDEVGAGDPVNGESAVDVAIRLLSQQAAVAVLPSPIGFKDLVVEICKNCWYYHGHPFTDTEGECHRFPPQVTGEGDTPSAYPIVGRGDHCGEWTRRNAGPWSASSGDEGAE